MKQVGRALAGLVVIGVVLGAAAMAEAQDLQYKLRNRVPAGQSPAVVVLPGEPIKAVTLTLERSDGKVQTVKKANLKPGKEVELAFPQPEGSWSYVATLTFESRAGVAGEAKFKFEAVVATAVKVSLNKPRSSVDERRIVLLANAQVERAEYEVIGERGVIDQGEHDLSGVPAGEELQITWRGKGDQAVEKINIKIFDPAGYWTSVELVPFTVDIPHEEVEFDTGKSSFGPTEAAKLDRTYVLLKEELAKHGDDLEIQLFIAGYTDTVGAAGANITLSNARARAIAAYFRRKGITIPIYFQGFGESVLAVPTGDNVDEARNRRALYILGNQAPPTSGQIPASKWQRL